jgi:hypothetical protein
MDLPFASGRPWQALSNLGSRLKVAARVSDGKIGVAESSDVAKIVCGKRCHRHPGIVGTRMLNRRARIAIIERCSSSRRELWMT